MKDNTKVFEEYTVPKAVMTMALPSMLSMLINIVYNLADTFFVGQTGDSNQVAAVSVSMPLFLLFIATGNLFWSRRLCICQPFTRRGQKRQS